MSDDFRGLWSRRQLLRRAGLLGGAAVGGSVLAACGGQSLDNDTQRPQPTSTFGDPRNGQRFDVELTPLGDEFVAPIFGWYGDRLHQESGIRLAKTISYPSYGEAQAVLPQIIGGRTPPFNLMTYASLFFGDVVASGAPEPLDGYLENFDGYEQYRTDVSPVFEFFTRFQDQTYGLMADGDVLMLHYRPSYFEDDQHRNAFESRFGRELAIPETWQDYVEVAEYFTDALQGQGVYGTQVFADRSYAWAFFFNIAASNGVRYFSEDMEPLVNSPEAVEALDLYKRMQELSPPGAETFGGDETIGNWQQGRVVMTPWWQDLREFSARANAEIGTDVNNAVLPGWEGASRRAMVCFNRTFSVPRNQSDEQKAAAAYVVYRLSHPDYSIHSCADPLLGIDPYMAAHFSDEAAAAYTQPNPLREGTEENVAIFQTVDQARDHLKGISESIAVGFPQPTWPGTPEYVEVLGTEIQSCLAGAKTSKQALDDAASRWADLVERRGREQQMEFYADFSETAERLGLY
ncbi:MAG: ABC transporter substrate-binding protein [Haloechinothrix sp.]